MGEHGDSSFPALSSASIGGQPIQTFPNYSDERAEKAFQKAKNAASTIIASKGSTYYGIGSVLSHMVKQILQDSKSVLPLSIPLHNYYGHSGVSLSVPCIIGREGVEKVLEIKLDWNEQKMLQRSVKGLKEYL